MSIIGISVFYIKALRTRGWTFFNHLFLIQKVSIYRGTWARGIILNMRVVGASVNETKKRKTLQYCCHMNCNESIALSFVRARLYHSKITMYALSRSYVCVYRCNFVSCVKSNRQYYEFKLNTTYYDLRNCVIGSAKVFFFFFFLTDPRSNHEEVEVLCFFSSNGLHSVRESTRRVFVARFYCLVQLCTRATPCYMKKKEIIITKSTRNEGIM